MTRPTVDVAIVGGGIMGMSIAYQIARRSAMSVIVLEKGIGLGEGSTGGSSAITRQRYSRPEQVRLARDANAVFRHWSDYVGIAQPRAVYRMTGVLWMLCEAPEVVESERARLSVEGVEVAVIGPSELQERFPALSACQEPFDLTGRVAHIHRDGEAFLLELDSGFFDATAALDDVAEAATRSGIDIRLGARVVDVTVSSGRAQGVVLADGTRLDAGYVINAAGPWCNAVNQMVGLEHSWDLVPTRVQILYRSLPSEVPGPIPVVADGSTGIYFRPDATGGQVIVGSILEEDETERVDPDDYLRSADRDFLDTKVHGLHHRIPGLAHRGIIGGMAGLYTMNRQDVHPIIGPTPVDGFGIANGFSGHGFKESQMVGSLMAQWITGERAEWDTDVPISFYSIDRNPIDVGEKNVLA